MKTLAEIQESIAAIQKEYKELTAAPIQTGITDKKDDNNNQLMRMYDLLYRLHDNVYNYASTIAAQLNDHQQKGHLPMMNPGQMAKALKTLGMDDSYEVNKHQVSCAGKNQYIIEAEMKKS